ncbi:heme-binding domain-containing protein [Sulfurovum mangrovi]|uniref:heme-binding domain-containing protein n=1 Tax=Sulfurovum mangrovi TaxID=2893889 RepID=UPI001E3E77A3|nr:heme-binding domain-containing protein [Sulfurovum mangrovi]UFH60064.1 heme-binding domain-containing protein [Sulfurovum mangrovi]
MKKSVLGVIALFLLIQFIPIGRDHTNPPIQAEPQWDSPKTKALFDRACADCHSHTTEWPWYSNLAPLSWIIADHVTEGREHFNVSAWGVQKHNEGEEAAEELEEGEMPVFGYTLTHPEARLSKEEKQRLIQGLEATFGREEN